MKTKIALLIFTAAVNLAGQPAEGKALVKFRSGIVSNPVMSLDGRKTIDGVIFSGDDALLNVSLVLARHPGDHSAITPIKLPAHDWWRHVNFELKDSTGRRVTIHSPVKLVTASILPPGVKAPSRKSPYLFEGQIIKATLSVAAPAAGDYRVSVKFMDYSDEYPLKVRLGNETPEVRVAYLRKRLEKSMTDSQTETVLRELSTLDLNNADYPERLRRIALRNNRVGVALIEFERAQRLFARIVANWTENAKKHHPAVWSELQTRNIKLSSAVATLHRVSATQGLVIRAAKGGGEETFEFEDRSGNRIATLRLHTARF